ncbi:hypothetical protein EVAR_6826_1 [Eumeta japonica]|uniref:Uncharacterized protein n=1 Tax=Eumeta variegata TaxID=151549 RepID=A0A4C1U7D3_EUMVA|nr:hypothetical protein EVAR_6826_1 [Eumeta japonica]
MAPLEQKVRSSPRLQRGVLKVTTPTRKRSPVKGSKMRFNSPIRGSARKLKEESVIRSSVKQKENSEAIAPPNSAKKRRGPKAAHSGVPVPDKMRKLLEKLNKEEGLKVGPKTPLKCSTVLKTLTPKVVGKAFPLLNEKPAVNINRNLSKSLITPAKREQVHPHSGVPVTDKMQKLREKNCL